MPSIFFSQRSNHPVLITFFLSMCSLINCFALHPELSSKQNLIDEKKIISLNIDYKNCCSELCLIGTYYDTDKSSQRHSIGSTRHCHPYTLFYNSIFRDKKDESLNIAELGILYGASLLMERDYFKNAMIYGFDNNIKLINSFNSSNNDERIQTAILDVKNSSSISNTFQSIGVQYDLIIEDTTHELEDQLRVIENIYPYLKNGGMLIVEDIFKRYKEQDYIDRLKPILHEFQDFYFVSMDHKNRYSPGWDNDKILVLVRGGGDPIFKNRKKMTIITPCSRPQNLHKVKDSIDFNYVDEWIIVYDGSKIANNPNLFVNEGQPKIKEYIHTSPGASGNPQRNYALDHIQTTNTFLYFLDDDNTIHKDLYKLLDIADDHKLYTFGQKNGLSGSQIQCNYIDTAMFMIDFDCCRDIRWNLYAYGADCYFIKDCFQANKDNWIFVNNELCTYNTLRK